MSVRKGIDPVRPLLLVAVLATGATVRAAEFDLSLDGPLDPAVVYRFDPLTEKLTPITVEHLKPRNVYYRHSSSRGHHVWSQVDDHGILRFELGPGSSFPVRLFDLVGDLEVRRQKSLELDSKFVSRLVTESVPSSLRLDADGRWSRDSAVNEGRIFDGATGERFAWHMGKPVPIVNTGGNTWIFAAGRYHSPFPGYGGPEPACDDFCSGCPVGWYMDQPRSSAAKSP